MILSEYAKFLQLNNEKLITHQTTPIELLHSWLIGVINKNPKNNYEKIVHKEIMYAQNENDDYIIIGKSPSGRKLLTALINFAKSYENYNEAVWKEMAERNFHSKN